MTRASCNRRRGEVIATIGGEQVTLRLTLGALAELESAFSVGDLGELAGRFSRGAFSAGDLQAIVSVAMRGAGRQISDDEAAALPVAGELPGLVAAVADLLSLTFGDQAIVENAAQAGRTAPVGGGASGPLGLAARLRSWLPACLQLWRALRSHFPGMR